MIRKLIRKLPGTVKLHRMTKLALQRIKHFNNNTEDIFSRIYSDNSWGGLSSVSGRGSDPDQTAIVAEELPKLVNKIGAKRLLDIPCGDFNWMRNVDLGEVEYIGADIVEDLINKNIKEHTAHNIRFEHLDLIKDKLPQVDLVLCRDCMVHLTNRDIAEALKNICESGSQFLLATTFTNRRSNVDITTGDWRPINLQSKPFSLPDPILLIDEKCEDEGGIYSDKSLGLWKISTIASVAKN